MSLGISGDQYQHMSQEYIAKKYATNRYLQDRTPANLNSSSGATESTGTTNTVQSGYVSNTDSVFANQQTSAAVSAETGNTCTDEKDDGKIGFFSAIGHAVKGAVKGVVNAVKGCFTNKEGKFSLGKTLLTVATAAVCIAFPAVGLVAAGIGCVVGAVKTGVGIYNAATATTDAQAKDAWENVGDGALTVAVSVAGAKASYGAVQATAAKSGATAVSQLGEDASLLTKAGALGKDMVTSTKNQAGIVKSVASDAAEVAKIESLRAQVAKIDTKGALTDEELALVRELEAREAFMTDSVASKVGTVDDALGTVRSAKDKVTIENAKSVIQNAKDKVTVENARAILKNAGQKVTRENASAFVQNIKNSASKVNIRAAIQAMPQKGRAVLNFLTTEEGTYAQAIQKFGYNNVAEALEVFAAYQLTDQTV